MTRTKVLFISIGILILIGIVFVLVYFKNTPSSTEEDGGGISLRDFFPFGQQAPDEITPDQTDPTIPPSEGGETPINGESVPRLRQISTSPVAGATSIITTRTRTVTIPPVPIEGDSGGDPSEKITEPKDEIITEEAEAIRYVEKTTGHIYETYTDMLESTRITNTTIPRIHDAYFDTIGNTVVLRYLDTSTSETETFLANIVINEENPIQDGTQEQATPEIQEYKLEGSFMTNNITDITISPDMKSIFTIEPATGGSTGIITDFLLGTRSIVLFSPLTEWQSFWPSNNLLTLTTKPSGEVPGYMFIVNRKSGIIDKQLGGILGLTTKMSPDEKKVLYSNSESGRVKLNLYTLNTRVTSDLGVRTLPEKCIWQRDSVAIYCAIPDTLPTGTYPDTWYQGAVNFSDSLWYLNIETNVYDKIVEPTSVVGQSLDMTNLFFDPKGEYIFFTDKTTSTLWSYRLNP